MVLQFFPGTDYATLQQKKIVIRTNSNTIYRAVSKYNYTLKKYYFNSTQPASYKPAHYRSFIAGSRIENI